MYKMFNTARPLLGILLPGLFGPKTTHQPADDAGPEDEKAESKKQAKLRARMEKGDKRVQQVQRSQR